MASTERGVMLADGLSARRDVPSTWSIGAAAVRRVGLAQTERRRTSVSEPLDGAFFSRARGFSELVMHVLGMAVV